MPVEIIYLASPFTAGKAGAHALGHLRYKLGKRLIIHLDDCLSKGLIRTESEIAPILINAVKNENYMPSKYTWTPEFDGLVRAIARPVDQTVPIDSVLNPFLLRATVVDLQGEVIPPLSAPGVSSLWGLPLRSLVGKKFRRQAGKVFLGEKTLPLDNSIQTIHGTSFKGYVNEFVEVLSNSKGVDLKLEESNNVKDQLCINDAIDLLEQLGVSPLWVQSAIPILFITKQQKGISQSGSSELHKGLVYISRSNDLYEIAETLLHEACHQNFYLGNIEGALEEDDGVERYSEPVGGLRPIWRILLAYQAFANVAIFYSKVFDKIGSTPVRANHNLALADSLQKTLENVVFSKPKANQMFQCIREIYLPAAKFLRS